MDFNTLEALIKRVYEISNSSVSFIFQGGEPTLAGLDFYENLLFLQEKHNRKNLSIANSIQTNGLLIDRKWAKFLSKNRFLVGLSLDGPEEIHSLHRKSSKGISSYNKVMETVSLLKEYKITFNILSVVTKDLAKNARKVYKYYSKMGFKDLQFIPCLDKINDLPGQSEYSLTPEIYGDFLKQLFDLWYQDYQKGNIVRIRLFDDILNTLAGFQPASCDMRASCSPNLVVEADGSTYPCDFYANDRWKLGNLKDNSIYQLYNQEKLFDFINESKYISNECKDCQYLFLCKGGCNRHYEPIEKDKLKKNYFCLAYKEFYKYTLDRFSQIYKG